MAYCTTTYIRSIANLSVADISDVDLQALIDNVATPKLNADLNTNIEDEKVVYISAEKENDVDGTNATFYTQHYPVADSNDDGTVAVADVVAYTLDEDGVRTVETINTLTANSGKVVLASAPATTDTLYFTYEFSPMGYSEADPHPLITLACAQLAAAWAFSKIEISSIGMITKYQVDRLVMNIASGSSGRAFSTYLNLYQNTLNEIFARLADKADTSHLI